MDENIMEDQNQSADAVAPTTDAELAAATAATTKVPDEKAVMELEDVFDKIKTHFPPAKVKKIMQTDEDIGKVSQATPVIAGRSLEFFIALLVKRSSDTARRLGCKRISGEVMKETILTDEKFDFLRENVCGEKFEVEGDDQDQDSSTNE
ncbi:H2A super protein [Zygosaccharomyces mellis]|uniref:H2A super protein n=1 Tax=Zygosaccharomyces mellis TaxID=42258 RepID=A0A4C2E3N4_9SACH|nr:H2A super protein [Zygosaccharomyces mellis]